MQAEGFFIFSVAFAVKMSFGLRRPKVQIKTDQMTPKPQHAKTIPRDEFSELIAAAPKLNGKVMRLSLAEQGIEGCRASDYAALAATVNAACERFLVSRGMGSISIRDQITNSVRNHNAQKIRKLRKEFIDDLDADLIESDL